MRDIAEVGETLFCCGYGGQIYRRDATGWRDVAPALRGSGFDTASPSQSGEDSGVLSLYRSLRQTVNLEAIDGSGQNDVYSCGLAGQIYHSSGRAWHSVPSPTDENLLDLHCVSSEEIIISGYNETLLRGNARQGFSVLHGPGNPIQFYSVRQFQGDIYVGTTQGLRRFNGTGFDVVRDGRAAIDETTVIQQIDSVSDNYLWIIGDRHVYRFDGQKVERFLHPDNV
ncbi:hypothetical protein [Consotaella aegiceratis]|uniref:hypothetical protein n=1 Tax=Consotaella aegiceratis TaxID=3097961 RepID=UPI002F3E1E80